MISMFQRTSPLEPSKPSHMGGATEVPHFASAAHPEVPLSNGKADQVQEKHMSTSSDTSSEFQEACPGSTADEEDGDGDHSCPRSHSPTSLEEASPVYIHPEIFCEVPEGVEIRPNAYGYGIFATRRFSAGDTIYQGYSVLVEDKPGKVPLKTSHGGNYMLDVVTHTVKQWDEGMRQMYAFDSFMNHSCDPNNVSVTIYKNSAEVTYFQQAVRHIAPGEEITCDYTLFEYDCPDKAIDPCECGSQQCLRCVYGFKHLTLDQKLQRLPWVDQCVIDAWLADDQVVRYYDLRRTIPDSVRIEDAGSDDEGHPCFKMIANRDFAKDETVFANQSVYINEGECLVVVMNSKAFQLNLLTHTINRGNGLREFYGFDSFMNHACEPNSLMVYNSATSYRTVCCKPIPAGTEITCDYETFDDMLDGSIFECWCGAPSCRKFIKG